MYQINECILIIIMYFNNLMRMMSEYAQPS